MNLFNLSQETIDFQLNDPFPKECDAIIESIFNKIESLGKTRDYCTYTFACNNEIEQLQDLIFKRFGLKNRINCDNNPGLSGAVKIPFGHQNIFFKRQYLDIFQSSGKDKVKLDKKINTEVDLKSVRAKGELAETPIEIYLNFQYFFNTGATNKETTAILLHEIGHVFTFIEYGYALESGNVALLNLVKGFKDKDEKVIKQSLDYLCESPCYVTPDDILNNFNTACPLVYTKFFKDIKSQFGDSRYDNTSSEFSADLFVVRFGYQVHLATVFEKYVKDYNVYISNYRKLQEAAMVISALWAIVPLFIFAGPALSAYVTTFLVLYTIGSAFDSAELVTNINEYRENAIYDDIDIRVKRMKQQSIVFLKEIKAEPIMVKKFISDIDKIGSLNLKMEKTHFPLFYGLMDSIDKFLNGSRRTREHYYQLQRDLEEIGYNELFVESQRFRHL